MSEQNEKINAPMEQVSLKNDAGAEISFTGRLYAEHSYYDEESGVLTQQKLYVTNDGCQAYSVVSSGNQGKERRAYIIRREGPLCKINNGLFDVTVTSDHLVTVVKGLCGMSGVSRYEDFFNKVTENDQAVNE